MRGQIARRRTVPSYGRHKARYLINAADGRSFAPGDTEIGFDCPPKARIGAVGAKAAYITPGSPWENGYVGSFNARLRDELLNGGIHYTLREAQIIIESWRRHDNTIRPHGALGYRPPAPEMVVPTMTAWPAALARPAPPAKLPVVQRPTLHQLSTRTTPGGPIRSSVTAIAR